MASHIPKFGVIKPKIIKDLEIKLFPFYSLDKFIKKLLAQKIDGKLLASSMTLGNSLAKDFLNTSDTNQRLIIGLDANLMYSYHQNQLLTRYFSNHKNIFFLPISKGRTFDNLFHWKIIVDDRLKTSFLSSSNLASPAKTNYLDLVYQFENKELNSELYSRLYDEFSEQCQAEEDIYCLEEYASGEGKENKNLISNSCKALEKYPLIKRSNKQFFVSPQETNVETLIVNLIKEAREEIVLLSHHFSSRKIGRELREAEKKGLKVFAVVGDKPKERESLIPKGMYNLTDVSSQPFPHMKVILIDNEMLIFGTGNFTQSGLFKSRELFGITDSQEAIQEVLNVISYYRSILLKKSYNLNKSNNYNHKEVWIVLNTEKERVSKLSIDEVIERMRLISKLIKVESSVSSRFRKLKEKEFMKYQGCLNITQNIFSEDDFFECHSKL